MNRHATAIQESSPTPPLPGDHVLNSGAVLFPGAFDQHGCPLILFPADGQSKLASELSELEVADFINHFLCLHNKKQDKESLVSVVADMRQASLTTSRFIAETLLLLEMHRRTVHTVYMIQPKKRDHKLLLKLLAPSKSCTAPFKKVVLKEISELSNYIDRSQLTPSLGGYFVYCHQSWVTFIKEINAFVQEFLSVVQRLPACISTLQALSRLPVPSALDELKVFCSTNEERFRQLRRELGLDELLKQCEDVVEKLRYPESEPCYQDMAGTALFTHTAFDMLQNYGRITAAVEKIELLWQQAFSKAHVQLRVLRLHEQSVWITEQVDTFKKEKLHPYRIEIAKNATTAEILTTEFEASIYTPGMALVRWAEDVIHTLAETIDDAQTREKWVEDLEWLKENFHAAVEMPYQTLRAVCDFYHHYNKWTGWYNSVLCENFLLELLWGIDSDSLPRGKVCRGVPGWRQALSNFLRKNPLPDMEELVQLAHLANVMPDALPQQAGKRLSQRCMTLRKLLTSPGAVPLNDLQQALQWQYEFLRSRHTDWSHAETAAGVGPENVQNNPVESPPSFRNATSTLENDKKVDVQLCDSRSNLDTWGVGKEVPHHQPLAGLTPASAVSGAASAVGKPLSLSSFDSGFDGAGSSRLEAWAGREGWERLPRPAGTRDSRPANQRQQQPQIHEENISSVSDSEDHREAFGFGSVGNSSRASIQIIPKITVDSLNFEIKVKRSATLPLNPWLSLPVEDLENSYTVTITPNPPVQQSDSKSPDPTQHPHNTDLSDGSEDQPTETEVSTSPHSEEGPQTRDWMSQSQTTFEDCELSPIRNVLSSTITDGRDKSNCTTEEVLTLLWDSYDFHDQKQDTYDGINCSVNDVFLNDWDLKEHEGLREVEKILDWADEILEEEENVLAQEALLDGLLKTDGSGKQWTLWGIEDHLGVMSSSDLAEAGVLCLDSHVSADSEKVGERTLLESTSETEALENNVCHDDKTAGASVVHCSRGELLKDLVDVHVLDELIVEENLKIHELRRLEETLEEKVPEITEPQGQGTGKKRQVFGQELEREKEVERQVFGQELEREKKEVERMEKNLAKEMNREHKLKKQRSRARKVVKCSIMDTSKMENLDDRMLCNELLSGSKSQCLNSQYLTSLVPHNSLDTDMHETNGPRATADPDTAKETTLQDIIQPVDTQPTDTNYGEGYLNSSVCDPTVPNVPQSNTITILDSSDPEVFHEEVGFQPLECVQEKGLDSGSGQHAGGRLPEASLTPGMKPDDGAFDPGGNSNCPPVPKPRKTALPVADGVAERLTFEPLYITVSPDDPDPGSAQTDVLDPQPKPKPRKNKPPDKGPTLILDPRVEEQRNNNNSTPLGDDLAVLPSNQNDSYEISTRLDRSSGEDGSSEESSSVTLVSDSLLRTESHHSQDMETTSPPVTCLNWQSPPQSPEDIPGSRDPGGSNGPSEDIHCHDLRRAITKSSVNRPQLDINTIQLTKFKMPIVLDTGSGLMKAGFADQDLPTTVFPTIIGLPKYEEIMNGNFERESYIGHEAQHMRGVLSLKYPMKNGIICNWDEMEKIWHHTFQQLRVDPEDHPVLMTEAAMNPLENRRRMVELMFECFNVPLTYVAMQAVLALYAAGRSTGVVFSSGDGISHSVPVFEGYSLPYAVQRLTLGGYDVTMHLKKLLQEQGVCMRTTAEIEIVREMKERCCRVALDYESELRSGGPVSAEYYTMPDGQVVSLCTERFRAPEILFKPELIGRDHYGMHESIFKSILSTDIDLRRNLLGNIVLSGGNTLLSGLPERLEKEIGALVPSDMREFVCVTSPEDRDFSVWSGGAMLANLPSFASAWITREEFEEYGSQIVFRKCF